MEEQAERRLDNAGSWISEVVLGNELGWQMDMLYLRKKGLDERLLLKKQDGRV